MIKKIILILGMLVILSSFVSASIWDFEGTNYTLNSSIDSLGTGHYYNSYWYVTDGDNPYVYKYNNSFEFEQIFYLDNGESSYGSRGILNNGTDWILADSNEDKFYIYNSSFNYTFESFTTDNYTLRGNLINNSNKYYVVCNSSLITSREVCELDIDFNFINSYKVNRTSSDIIGALEYYKNNYYVIDYTYDKVHQYNLTWDFIQSYNLNYNSNMVASGIEQTNGYFYVFDRFSSPLVFLHYSNSAPNITSVVINDSLVGYLEDFTFTNITTDADNDTIIQWSIKWYINDILNESYKNKSVIYGDNTTYGQNWIVNLKAFDGESWSNSKNSSMVFINDTYAPIYLEGTPTSGIKDIQLTLTLLLYDYLNVSSATISLIDPDYLVELNDESMSYNKSELNINGTYNLTYIKSYTPTKTGDYQVSNITATDQVGNQLIQTQTTWNLSVITTTTIGGGGGGGGDTTIIIGSEIDYDIIPEFQDISVRQKGSKSGEFQIVNQASKDINISIYINKDKSDIEFANQKIFNNLERVDNLILPFGGDLESNIKYIRFTIDGEEIPIGEYNLFLTIESNGIQKEHVLNITVNEEALVSLKNFMNTSIFEFNDNVFKLSHLIVIIIIISIIIWMVTRK